MLKPLSNTSTNKSANIQPVTLNVQQSKQTQQLKPEDLPAIKYVESMRKKGIKDEVILYQLRSKGWKEETLSKIFKLK